MGKYVNKGDILNFFQLEDTEENREKNLGEIITLELIDQLFDLYGINLNSWISFKDQKPEDCVSILICSERGTVSKATYDSDMGWFYIADSELHYNELDITYWMPLPQPPKE